MSASKIEWTEHTWNPVVGCSIISPGCTNCYAMRQAARLHDHPGSHYEGTTRRVNGNAVWTGKVGFASEATLLAPLKRKKPTTWFVNSMGDLFHESIPDERIDRIFAVMALAPQHRFQVLTKRARRMREYCSDDSLQDRLTDLWAQDDPDKATWSLMLPLTNVWLGISAEDQANADERIPDLLQTPAVVRFVSLEPLLGPIDLTFIANGPHESINALDAGRPGTLRAKIPHLDWVIVGGESGKGARPMHPDWVRSIKNQCASAGIPFFFKQWGEWLTGEPGEEDYLTAFHDGSDFANISDGADIMLDAACEHRGAPDHLWKNYWASGDGHLLKRVGKKAAGRLLDGELHDGMPG